MHHPDRDSAAAVHHPRWRDLASVGSGDHHRIGRTTRRSRGSGQDPGADQTLGDRISGAVAGFGGGVLLELIAGALPALARGAVRAEARGLPGLLRLKGIQSQIFQAL